MFSFKVVLSQTYFSSSVGTHLHMDRVRQFDVYFSWLEPRTLSLNTQNIHKLLQSVYKRIELSTPVDMRYINAIHYLLLLLLLLLLNQRPTTKS